MERRDFFQRVGLPVVPILGAAAAGYLGYLGADFLGNDAFRLAVATLAGAVYFAAVAFGAIYVYAVAALRGATPAERLMAIAVTPLAWATKESLLLLESHSLLECLYWYLNPLNIWLAVFMVMEVGIAQLIVRRRWRKVGRVDRVWAWKSGLLIFGGLSTGLALFAWGQGENVYVMFLEGYRALFGSGLS